MDSVQHPTRIDEINALTAELDLVDTGKPLDLALERPAVAAPVVRIGRLSDGGLAPALAAIVERGVRRRPALAAALEIELEIKVEGPYPAIRISFRPDEVLVEDGSIGRPDLRVEGPLPDLIHLLSAPIGVGGVPNVISARGRAALGKVATGKVRFEGPIGLRRRVLILLHI